MPGRPLTALVILLAAVTLLVVGSSDALVRSPRLPPPAVEAVAIPPGPPPELTRVDGACPPPLPTRQEDLLLGEGPLPPRSEADAEAILGRIRFLVSPIAGASVVMPAAHLPGAPRDYRQGWHQGTDYYDGHAGVPVGFGDPVRAAGPGIILRADAGFVDLTPAEREAMLAECARTGETSAAILDLLHGRQVWVAHAGGVVTRYSHLAEVAAGLRAGSRLEPGQLLGTVGNSGTAAGAQGSREGAHLHFEIHLDGAPFWLGLSLDDIRAVLGAALEDW